MILFRLERAHKWLFIDQTDYSLMKLIFHGVGHYPSGEKFGPARWPHADLLALREGELEFETRHGVLKLHAGDAIWIPASVRFWGVSHAERSKMWVVHFRDRNWNLADVAGITECGVGVFRGALGSELSRELMNRLEEFYLGDNQWKPWADTYFAAFLAEIRRNHLSMPPENPWLERLKARAKEQLPHGIGARELAQHAGLSESHLRQRFRKQSGLSIGYFLRELRLREAEKLLRQSQLGLKEISARVGYSDPAAFHRAFSRMLGTTPRSYRKCAQAAL